MRPDCRRDRIRPSIRSRSLYVSTGVDTRFINGLDPDPKSRRISHLPHIHRPETLDEWLKAETLDAWVKRLHLEGGGVHTVADETRPSSLRGRIQTLPELEQGFLYPVQVEAVGNVDWSLKRNHPRSLVQMATGSGKTIFAITSVYRLIRYAGARRVLFLVDRSNLGEQAEKEFQGFRTPDDHRKFTELYTVQRLTSNTIGAASKVVITTIQRLYSMLKGEPDFAAEDEAASQFESGAGALSEPLPVVYNAAYPPEYFDVIVIDECHRSIYTVWRQVLEYFDAFLIGLTATPAKQTFGFFNKNLVMEYDHERAVADGVNVDFEVYDIRTRITGQGATIQAKPDTMVEYRDRQTRQRRWERPDEDITYDAAELDRRVVARDQIRTVVRTFRDRLFTDIFPGRTEVPKTLVFAKDDSHAEDIVEIVRDEFGRGNDFCQKITYKVTAAQPRDLIQAFRNSFEPRIAVTVDMISTGADIRPIEIVMFMRAVKSRVLFEQMKGRGVRVIDARELQAVTPDARAKTHFVIVDCVGVSDAPLADTQPLERKKSVSFQALLEHVAMGGTDPAMLSSLASRLARFDRQCGPEERERIAEVSGGAGIGAISHAIVDGLDPDRQVAKARSMFDVPAGDEPTEQQVKQAATTLLKQAAEPIATRPALRHLLEDIKRKLEQLIDDISVDELDRGGGERGGEAEGEVAGRFVRAIHRGQQGRDRRPPVLLRDAVRQASPLQRPQDAGRRNQGAAPRLDAREALAGLRDTGQAPGPRRVGAAAAHRPRLPRAVRNGPGRRVDAVRRARPGAFRPLARAAAHRGPRLHTRAGPLAGDDSRPHRGQRGDDGGGSRLRAVRGGRWPGPREADLWRWARGRCWRS